MFIYCKITLHVSAVYRTHHQEYITAASGTGHSVRATTFRQRGLRPAASEIFRACPDGPWGPPSTMGTGSFPGVKSGRCLTLPLHPLLVPWSRKSRATPLLLLWAVRPVQSLSACTTVCLHCYNSDILSKTRILY